MPDRVFERSLQVSAFKSFKEQIVKLEKQVNDRVAELNRIKSDLKKNESIVCEQSETIQNILNERDNLNNMIQKLNREKVRAASLAILSGKLWSSFDLNAERAGMQPGESFPGTQHVQGQAARC